jgi:hypothetical protein
MYVVVTNVKDLIISRTSVKVILYVADVLVLMKLRVATVGKLNVLTALKIIMRARTI